MQGATSSFTNAGDSGRKLTRRFCPRCGSMLTIEAEGFPGMTLIMGGTLDDASWLKPTVQLFCDSARERLLTVQVISFPASAGCSWPALIGGLWHF